MENTNMEKTFSLDSLATYAAAAGAIMIENFIEHPVSTVMSIVALLYTYDKWRTQRIERKIKQKELESLK